MGLSPESLVILFIAAVFKTSFTEELFFRGFLAKRLIAWLGFGVGNFIQALIFGIIHVLIFLYMNAGIGFLIFMFLLSGLAGWLTAYINEKMANGSIIPGWIAHGLGNVLAYLTIGLLL